MKIIREYKSFLFIFIIIVISIFYINFIISIVNATSDLKCVENNENVKILGGYFSEITIKCKILTANEIGDYFAGLVSLLATFWLVVPFVWQAMELSFQRQEFRTSNAIALSRVESEEAKRKLDNYDTLCARLEAVVRDKLRHISKLTKKNREIEGTSLTALKAVAQEDVAAYAKLTFDQETRECLQKLQACHTTCANCLERIEELEKDPDIKHYFEIFS